MYCVDWSEREWWPEWPKNVRGHRWRIFLKSKVMERCIWPRRNFAGRGVCPHLGHLSFQPQSPRCRSPLSCFLIVLSYNFSLETPTGISDRGLTLPPWLLVRQRVPQSTNIYWTIPQQTPRLYPSYFIQHPTTLWEQKEGRLPALSAVQSQSQRQPGKSWSSRAGREKTAGFVSQCLLLSQSLDWHSCIPCSAKRWLGAVGCAAWGCSLSRGLWRRSSPFSFTPSRKLLIVFRLCLPLPPVSHAQIFQCCPISTWTAGVRGTISRYLVTIPTPSSTYHFYEMDIIGLEQDWPERKERSREMVDYAEAIQRLEWKSELAQALKLSSIAPRRWKVST